MNLANFPWLTTIILFPIVAALLIPIIPDKDGKTVRWYALTVGLIDFAIIVYAFYTGYDLSNPNLQLVESYAWVPELDLKWSVGADGLAMPLIFINWLYHHLGNDGRLASYVQTQTLLFSDVSHVRGTNSGLCCTGYVIVLPSVGIGISPGLSDFVDMGWKTETLRGH